MTSSPLRAGATLEDELNYYKKQYDQLETDLADFQASSKELEEQLERDIDTAEKNERKLKERVEKLSFEVEEWKTKHKQAKTEANSAQNALQKEITTLRESNRSLQLKLRDIEVVNDDYERQARNTESSLEDLESKYNVAIERSVMSEEEIKVGEQEREALRIETQRLRDELGDLKVESDITQEKLRLADQTIERMRSRKPSPLAVESLRARSPASEASGITPSSPTASTPPPKSDTVSDAPTPPSPPLSDAPVHTKREPSTPLPPKRQSLLPDSAATPRLSLYGPRAAPGHSRGPSMASSNGLSASDAKAMKPPATKPRHTTRPSNGPIESLPRSDSLYQIKALRGRMQKIEERVHSARSKLPPPGTRTPTASPRTLAVSSEHVPASVTMRRSIKRPSGSTASSLANGEAVDGTRDGSRRESQAKRLSYGIPRPPPSAAGERSPSRAMDRPPSAAGVGRPSSRASLASASNRPGSRAGARTPLTAGTADFRTSIGPARTPTAGAGRTSTTGPARTSTTGPARPSTTGPARTSTTGPTRPRSSMGGTYATIQGTPRSHRPSASVSELRRVAAESEDSALGAGGTPGRRTTMESTALPTVFGFAKRQSGGAAIIASPGKTLRRISSGLPGARGEGAMRPPPSRRKISDVGETY
ncbi:hypothetical protein LTR36_006782 [Oleoguttula mirabilis]|uniref:NUDE domain-containing protein n=1 Tax=Oleoguttula mirabilis TaxID=1507867 RepID=A0AAV9JCK9_9PEZI|nr:hypothetical protein LTR36_006782 [Oleoguttula mirabilis]